MEKLEIKKEQELTFNVYGTTVKGKYISSNGDLITISITYDALGISKVGSEEEINRIFLVNTLTDNPYK